LTGHRVVLAGGRGWTYHLAVGGPIAWPLTCWAVGWNLIEQGTASGWNIVSAPDLPADGTLRSVACTSASDCWAVGYVTPNGGATQPLIEQGTDSGWTTVSSPSPSGSTDTELYSVTCASSGNCWAVGYNTAPTGGSQTLIEQDSGSGWSIVSSPNPAGVHGIFLYGVTCVGPSECWAVGSAGSQTLIEQETGGGWTIVPGATPPDSAGAQLVSVSCVSDGDCWAVGYSQALQVLIEEDTGSGWNIVDSPDITAAVSSQLEGVTCDGAGDCWAVGDYSTADGASEPLLFQEAGSGWIAASNPNSPGGAENSALDSVTCASATACWAVGSSWETGGATQTLIEQGT